MSDKLPIFLYKDRPSYNIPKGDENIRNAN